MKRAKRIIAILLSVMMIFSVTMFCDAGTREVKADTTFAITSPVAGSLKAAGYIDITWSDASSQGTVKNYKLYVDGSLVATTTKRSYEFYTTKVNYHTAWVVADFSNGTSKSTASVRFGVSKKGLGLATDMGAKLNLKDMGVAWYYNWGTAPSSGTQYEGIEYVPMQWGSDSYNNINNKMNNWAAKGYKYVLAFNEPDLTGQGVISVDDAVNRWPAFQNHGIRVGSPASFLWPTISTWLKDFMVKIDNNVDFITIHCYPENNPGGASMAKWFLETVVDGAWKQYHKPIWITEFSTSDTSNDNHNVTAQGTASFWENVMKGLDEREYVERYAAFGFKAEKKPGTALWYYYTGRLTAGGEVYKKLGNPTTDYKTGNATNNISNSQKNNTTQATVTKPAKAKIKSLKNKKGRKIKVSIKKIKNVAGYQIRWSDSKKFNGYWEKSVKKTAYTLKKLDKKTRYYIKVRAYVKNGSKKLYGSWSKAKNIKVKK
ncbi:MAG: glycosyl hydrolase [Eubacterium sp.]